MAEFRLAGAANLPRVAITQQFGRLVKCRFKLDSLLRVASYANTGGRYRADLLAQEAPVDIVSVDAPFTLSSSRNRRFAFVEIVWT